MTKLKTVPAVRTTCAWMPDPDSRAVWMAGCAPGRVIGGPTYNHGWKFCPYCGALIVETVWTGPDDVVSEGTTR